MNMCIVHCSSPSPPPLFPSPTSAVPSLVTITEERASSGVVSLTCNVEPHGGLYDITWNVPDSNAIGDGEGLSGSSVTVTPALTASGVYQCIASNDFGCATGEKTILFEGIHCLCVFVCLCVFLGKQ